MSRLGSPKGKVDSNSVPQVRAGDHDDDFFFLGAGNLDDGDDVDMCWTITRNMDLVLFFWKDSCT